ncbi:MAG: V-type ATP synthase subunit D [Ignisphaera sp.]
MSLDRSNQRLLGNTIQSIEGAKLSSEIIKLSRPTKIELIRLRRRLALSRRIHRILRDRLTFLMQEFYTVYRKAFESRRRLHEMLNEIYKSYSQAVAIHGLETLDTGANTINGTVEVVAGTRNVMGVVAPSMEISSIPMHTPALPIEVADIQVKRNEFLETLVSVAEYEKELIELAMEISRVRRVVMMLEKVLIPRLITTIRYLMMKFDEMEREEKVRSMKIKSLLLQRSEGV